MYYALDISTGHSTVKQYKTTQGPKALKAVRHVYGCGVGGILPWAQCVCVRGGGALGCEKKNLSTKSSCDTCMPLLPAYINDYVPLLAALLPQIHPFPGSLFEFL